MRKLIGTIAVATALLGALPVLAQPVPPATEAESTAAAPAKDRLELICRSVKSAGSRNASRECHTQEEWDGQSARLRGTGAAATAGK
jgi:hypothetical protein